MSYEWDRKCDELRKKRLEAMKEELFVRALEYARLKLFGATLKEGCWHLSCGNDGPKYALVKLEQLGDYACAIARQMTVAPNETQALTDAERNALKADDSEDAKP